jgi:hypothetical protein
MPDENGKAWRRLASGRELAVSARRHGCGSRVRTSPTEFAVNYLFETKRGAVDRDAWVGVGVAERDETIAPEPRVDLASGARGLCAFAGSGEAHADPGQVLSGSSEN